MVHSGVMSKMHEAAVRSARKRLDAGCAAMEDLLGGLAAAAHQSAARVHELRKLGKTLRGGFALFGLQEASRGVQAVGRLLADRRDAVSRRNTWRKLGWDADAEVCAAVEGLLDDEVAQAAAAPHPATLDWGIARVRAARDGLRDWHGDAALLEATLHRMRNRARRLCRRLDHRSPDDFHEARKALKAWLGAAALLPRHSLQPGQFDRELADLLGDENDVATLVDWLDRHGFTRAVAPDLRTALKRRRRKVQREVIRLLDGGR